MEFPQVIPPGMDFSNVVIQEDGPEVDGDLSQLTGGADGSSPKALPSIWLEVSNLYSDNMCWSSSVSGLVIHRLRIC
jgi:hypothetical protein